MKPEFGNKKPETRTISWRSPSNIALIKYWGKKPVQIPANPSLSMTLSKAYTELTLDFSPGKGESWVEVFFEGKKQENFREKITAYLQSLLPLFPVLKDYHFKISSFNTFPHSTGIASSASSMSALGLCLAEFIARVSGDLPTGFSRGMQIASQLSRLASGSACRSVYGGYVIWGHVAEVPGTSDDYAIPVPFEVSPVFNNIRDAILVVSSREKAISSRAGHALMEGHPYAEARYRSARTNLLNLSEALRTGDLDEFVRVTESEALNLHAMMMSSSPSYLLIEPNTLNIVNEIGRYRKETQIPVCFTLDAGPNVHLLYPGEYTTRVKDWINGELVKFCEKEKWIDDGIGNGPVRF